MSDVTPVSNNKLVIARRIARFVAVRSVSGVVVTAVHQNVAVEGKLAKIQLYVGTFLLGSMVADKVWDHTEKQIDEIVEAVQEARKAKDDIVPSTTDL